MTVGQKITRLEKEGYKITFLMKGGVIAKKGSRTKKATSITALYRDVFGTKR